jgi:protein involved in polysaccharide export with SLBB domain
MNRARSGVGAIISLQSVAKGSSVSFQHPSCWSMAAAITLLCLITVGAKADELTSPAAYKLGQGDQILINVFGEEDLSMDFQLNDTGTLNYPFLGELTVAGLSVTELEQLITGGLKGPYLVNPDVTVSIKEYRPFYIRGEVEKPGGLPYQPGLTLEKAIALSGGFTERASKKKTTVIRAGDTDPIARPIKLNDLVHAGDVITVPQSFF